MFKVGDRIQRKKSCYDEYWKDRGYGDRIFTVGSSDLIATHIVEEGHQVYTDKMELVKDYIRITLEQI